MTMVLLSVSTLLPTACVAQGEHLSPNNQNTTATSVIRAEPTGAAEDNDTFTVDGAEPHTLPADAEKMIVHKVVDGKVTVWKDYWDMNSLVSFAPPNHFDNLANADTSWIFDASALV